ncbi:MAG: DUF2339 domain-containing protein [Alphaproteobacteria bacterium]|nr:MAG: DUF2339 domain-containing protein [Alphaproteobacteria bacterium]
MEYILWFMLVIGFLVLVPVAAIVAFKARGEASRLRLDLLRVEGYVMRLERRVGHLENTDMPAAPPAPATEEPAKAPVVAAKAEPVADRTAASAPVAPPAAPPAPPPSAPKAQASAAAQRDYGRVERDLSSRWMMWVGGLALALGGAFLVKYSIDAGLLGPSVRIGLGVLLGLVLALGGDLVRRRRGGTAWLDGAPDYLPAALSAAGLFTLFASVYSAYALYDMIPPLAAFALLAVISVSASALAWLQGRFFAFLGLIGGMLVPMLVSTGSANPWGLFPYLLFIAGAALYVARLRSWVDVAGAALGFALLWVPVWIVTSWHTGDSLPVGLYLIVLGGLNIVTMSDASERRRSDPTVLGLLPGHPASQIADLIALGISLFLVFVVRLDHYTTVSLAIFALAVAGQTVAFLRSAEHDAGTLMLLLGALFLLACWHEPNIGAMTDLIRSGEAQYFAVGPIAPPGFERFATVATLLAGLVGFGLFAVLPSLLRKGLWASVGAGFPLLLLVVVYGRLQHFDTSVAYAGIAVAMAALCTLATVRSATRALPDSVVAAYAAGTTGALALALSMLLRDGWLSFSLALEVAALGWIWRTRPVAGLRSLAYGLAVLVLARLFLNPDVVNYGGGGSLGALNWLFYAYGLSAALFWLAARLFAKAGGGGRLDALLRGGAVLLASAFVTLEIRVLAGADGRLDGAITALEAALQTVNWMVASVVLYWLELRTGDRVFAFLRRVMTGLSLLGLLYGGGRFNGFVTENRIGSYIIFNLQFLQLLVPAVLYGLKAWFAHRHSRVRDVKLYGGLALGVFWFWTTAEVRHAFHPFGAGPTGNWEWYCYSAVWLVYAIGLLLAGLRSAFGALRMAGLGLLGFVVLKVFLFDMASLEGMARALSFMGLGAALIGVGYLYQRIRPKT